MEKKNPYKFTLGFDKTKPTHVRAAEILNSVRDKADLIASAVVAHIDGGSTEKGAVLNQEALQIMMLELVKQEVEKAMQNYSSKQENVQVEEEIEKQKVSEFVLAPEVAKSVMEHLDMNLKIVKYILNQGYEDKKIGGAFYQRVQVRNSCGGYGKVMAIFPEGDIYMCQCMEQNQVRMGNILSDEPQKILQELENLLKKDEIKRLFCAEYKEICKECDYRYICGGHCLASEEPYDYRCIFLKAVLNYVLFYYDSKANRRKNLEIYIEYMEEVKRRWEEEPN